MVSKLSNDVYNVGSSDLSIKLFEGQYKIDDGMNYNSYLILDEKIAILDTIDADEKVSKNWLENIEKVLNGKVPTYLIILHMEPDHSANIMNFLNKYPDTILVGNNKTFAMMDLYFDNLKTSNRKVVENNETLSLGKHNLTFVFASMVHWIEVMVAYDSYDKILFSADAFGTFGATLKPGDEKYLEEARRYYIGIVGKYGLQVQSLLKVASTLDIKKIASLHGQVLDNNLSYYLNKYDIWSSYKAEDSGVVIAYCSVYGNTKKAIEYLASLLKKENVKVKCYDLSLCDMSLAISEAFRYDRLVLATPTYNADIFPFMKQFINGLIDRNYQNRTIGLIENGSWAPNANRVMKTMFEKSKNITFTNDFVTIKATLNEQNKKQIELLANELLNK